ncbi:MAG: hypothetical protein ACKO67_08705 [Bacteroidota bacterium]
MKSLREKENLHVVFWLFKDSAWLMHYRGLGMAMAVPTILLSIWITWKSYRSTVSDFYHNLAISFWILGNAIWMTGEFFFNDDIREVAMPFFGAGLVVVAYFYGWVNARTPKLGEE